MVDFEWSDLIVATQPKVEQYEDQEMIRPPVPGGTGYVDSLGSFIDNLMGDRRISKKVDREIREQIVEMNSRPPEGAHSTPSPLPDPPPARPPSPIA